MLLLLKKFYLSVPKEMLRAEFGEFKYLDVKVLRVITDNPYWPFSESYIYMFL